MSEATMRTAGIVLVVLPTVMYGGVTLLRLVHKNDPGYMNNPVRQSLWRAGHAHAGVLLVLALVGMLFLEHAGLSPGMETVARACLVAPPILMPLGFFLSVPTPGSTRPNGMIALTYIGGVVLAAGVVILGVALLTQ